MARKRPASPPPAPQPEQLVFPFELRVGDVIVDDGAHAEVVGRPTAASGGKVTRAMLRREGETIPHEAYRGGVAEGAGGPAALRRNWPARREGLPTSALAAWFIVPPTFARSSAICWFA